MQQFFLIAGSGVALVAAMFFLFIAIKAIKAILRADKSNVIYAYVFFVLSMLILALYMFLWHSVLGSVGQETQSLADSAPTIAGLGQWGQILGGGIVAAFLTLSGREVVSWCRRPNITIIFEKDEKKESCYHREGPDPPKSYWLRVKVTNSGRSVAKSCVGKLVEFLNSEGKPIDHDPVRLHWIDTPWEVGTQLFATKDLYQGQSEFLDVMLAEEGSLTKASLFTGLKLENSMVRAKTETLPSVSTIRIEVYGDNFKPYPKEYSISWDNPSDYTTISLKEV